MSHGMHLSQRMAMSQILAPQLQQSLALLQAPTLELKALVEQELQVNPVLEEVPSLEVAQEEQKPREGDEPTETFDPSDPPADLAYDSATEKPAENPKDDWMAEFERLSQIDQDWRDHYAESSGSVRVSSEEEERRQFMFDNLTVGCSLQGDLLEQVHLSDLPREKWPVAEMIIGNIDDHGYLKASVNELAFSTNLSAELIEEVLKEIQTFDPVGVGARDLRECLILQLQRAGRTNELEFEIVKNHFEALGRRRLPEIARALARNVLDIQKAVERIGHLEPRPGREFMPDAPSYIVPEVFVQKVGEDYVVSTNDEHIPHLRISNTYKDLMSQSNSSQEVRDYIRDKIRAGKFLIKSIHQRQSTILSIGREILNRQREFMEHGVSHLRPMTMVQVAEVVGVHETTVSRAVSGKYIQTPQGVFEMKYFFTSGIQTSSGEGVSNASVKELLEELIKSESPRHPLSDDAIVKSLQEKGIMIARRTVAKYRSELNILPSHLRRTY